MPGEKTSAEEGHPCLWAHRCPCRFQSSLTTTVRRRSASKSTLDLDLDVDLRADEEYGERTRSKPPETTTPTSSPRMRLHPDRLIRLA